MNKKNIPIDLSINLELDEKDFRDGSYLFGGQDEYLRFISNLQFRELSDGFEDGVELNYVTAYLAEENNFDNN